MCCVTYVSVIDCTPPTIKLKIAFKNQFQDLEVYITNL